MIVAHSPQKHWSFVGKPELGPPANPCWSRPAFHHASRRSNLEKDVVCSDVQNISWPIKVFEFVHGWSVEMSLAHPSSTLWNLMSPRSFTLKPPESAQKFSCQPASDWCAAGRLSSNASNAFWKSRSIMLSFLCDDRNQNKIVIITDSLNFIGWGLKELDSMWAQWAPARSALSIDFMG